MRHHLIFALLFTGGLLTAAPEKTAVSGSLLMLACMDTLGGFSLGYRDGITVPVEAVEVVA